MNDPDCTCADCHSRDNRRRADEPRREEDRWERQLRYEREKAYLNKITDQREDIRMLRIQLEECKADFAYATGMAWRSGMQFLRPSVRIKPTTQGECHEKQSGVSVEVAEG